VRLELPVIKVSFRVFYFPPLCGLGPTVHMSNNAVSINVTEKEPPKPPSDEDEPKPPIQEPTDRRATSQRTPIKESLKRFASGHLVNSIPWQRSKESAHAITVGSAKTIQISRGDMMAAEPRGV
jgi:hypothetical protein